MKVLSFLNVSNLSNLEADSGYVFQRTVLEELVKCGHDVVFVGPYGMPDLAKEIEVIEMKFSQSKYGVRFGFPWEELATKLLLIEPNVDIVLVNQSELSVSLSLLLYEIFGKRVPCATYFHYLAVQNTDSSGEPVYDPSLDLFDCARFIWRRQVESALFSDINIIGSEFGRQLFLAASGRTESLKEKFTLIAPPIQDYIFREPVLNNEVPVLFYNHRLYNHYGNCEIFKLLAEVRKLHPFKVIVTDPTGKRSVIREKLDGSVRDIKAFLSKLDFVEIRYFDTQFEYYATLQNVDIGFAPFRVGALWNMATADVMSAGKPVIAPDSSAFPEIVRDQDLLFKNSQQFKEILIKLLTDRQFREEKGRKAWDNTQHLSAEMIGENFERVLLETLRRQHDTE